MSANRFGQIFTLTSFGESHGAALGVVIEGVPAGVTWETEILSRAMARRRPGQSDRSGEVLVSARQEADAAEVLSGVHDGRTLGTPIAVIVRNQDARSEDYQAIRPGTRRGHADDLWLEKFGHSDPRGGGRASGRETLARVIGGAVAEMVLVQAKLGIEVSGWLEQIGPLELDAEESRAAHLLGRAEIDAFSARFPSSQKSEAVRHLLSEGRSAGESFGAKVQLSIKGLPRGLGQPVFHKFKADLGAAMLSVGAVSGVELGETGPAKGTEFHSGSTAVYGGVRGGLTTGEPVGLRLTVKPTASILDVSKKGRHDPCVAIRAVPVLEAMAWLVIADHWLWTRLDRIV
jgi:chorismate synthase